MEGIIVMGRCTCGAEKVGSSGHSEWCDINGEKLKGYTFVDSEKDEKYELQIYQHVSKGGYYFRYRSLRGDTWTNLEFLSLDCPINK